MQTGDHRARYGFCSADGRVLLVQLFDPLDHHCASGVAAAVVGHDAHVEDAAEGARTLVSPAHKGKTAIVITNAAASQRIPIDEMPPKNAMQADARSSRSLTPSQRSSSILWLSAKARLSSR